MMKCHFENKQQVSGESKLLFNIFLSSIKKKETFFNFFFLLLYLGYVQTEDGQSILNLHFSCLQQIDCLCVCKRAVDCSIWTEWSTLWVPRWFSLPGPERSWGKKGKAVRMRRRASRPLTASHTANDGSWWMTWASF